MGVEDGRYDRVEALITEGKGEDTMGIYSNLPILKKMFWAHAEGIINGRYYF